MYPGINSLSLRLSVQCLVHPQELIFDVTSCRICTTASRTNRSRSRRTMGTTSRTPSSTRTGRVGCSSSVCVSVKLPLSRGGPLADRSCNCIVSTAYCDTVLVCFVFHELWLQEVRTRQPRPPLPNALVCFSSCHLTTSSPPLPPDPALFYLCAHFHTLSWQRKS